MPRIGEGSRTIGRSNKSRLFPDATKVKRPLFRASFERKAQPVGMAQLLGWEYGRQWLRERDDFQRRTANAKIRFIVNDYNWWLKKRNALHDRSKLYRRRQQQQQQQADAEKPNHNLSAFALAKKSRLAARMNCTNTN